MSGLDATLQGLKIATDSNPLQSMGIGTKYPADNGTFGNLFHAAAGQIQRLETAAGQATVDLLSGKGVDVHQAMIATQKSELAFELALQVRNKAVAAYQQMYQMQF